MGIQHCYEQSSAAWHREWCDEGSDDADMTEEDESEFGIEMDAVNAEAAADRKQEREHIDSSGFATMAMDHNAPF